MISLVIAAAVSVATPFDYVAGRAGTPVEQLSARIAVCRAAVASNVPPAALRAILTKNGVPVKAQDKTIEVCTVYAIGVLDGIEASRPVS